MGVTVTFMAILELVREGLIDIVQAEPYAPLHVRAATPARRLRVVADNGEPRAGGEASTAAIEPHDELSVESSGELSDELSVESSGELSDELSAEPSDELSAEPAGEAGADSTPGTDSGEEDGTSE